MWRVWAGIDVGGRRKGFHAALVDGERLRGLGVFASASEAAARLGEWSPRVVAVDSPVTAAPEGARSRAGERLLARDVCGIRYTPAAHELPGKAYYGWIVHGLELYEALRGGPWQVVECFPTASWTRWAGPRGSQRRARWTRLALRDLGLEGVPSRLSQDARDAIAAAVTARCFERGATEAFGEIVVPVAGPPG